MKKINIRVVAPSSQWDKSSISIYSKAKYCLEANGYTVSFSKRIKRTGFLGAASESDRSLDIIDAYLDKNVDCIIALNGGYLSNGILDKLNWEVIKSNPKPFIGYSDVTVLINAIFAKTGQQSLLGPMFKSLGREKTNYSVKCLNSVLKRESKPSYEASNVGKWSIVRAGKAVGTMIGGNVGSLYLLQGTEYMPSFSKPTVLVLEDDDEATPNSLQEFDRRIVSVMQQTGAHKNVVAVLVGRFEARAKVCDEDLAKLLLARMPKQAPIIMNMDFGHRLQMMTLNIGSVISVEAKDEKVIMKLK